MRKFHFLKFFFLLTSIIIFNLSCSETSEVLESEVNNDFDEKVVVLKERESPWVPSEYESIFKRKDLQTKTTSITFKDMLGYSYKTKYYPFEDTRNLGGMVIDVNKLSAEKPTWAKSWPNNTSDPEAYSFSDFYRYETKSTTTKKVSGGFKLDFKIFSIGSKNTYNSVFTESYIENNNATYGEIQAIIRKTVYDMSISSNTIKTIKSDFIAKDFKDELYNTHPSEFVSNYGYVVLTNFITGGKATAVATGIYKKTESSEIKEKKFDTELNASFALKKKENGEGGTDTANLTFGRGNSSTTSVTNEFSSIRMSVKTLGGTPSFSSFSLAKDIKDVNIDLSGWATSINTPSNESIIEFGDGSLYPITEFIPEENLKEYISYYSKDSDGAPYLQKLQEPYVMIGVGQRISYLEFFVGSFLVTRFGDAICLNIEHVRGVPPTNCINKEAERVSKMLDIKILKYEFLPPTWNISTKVLNILEPNLSKFTHNGVVYIINNEKKAALSIHKDSYIDEYGMRELINRLPTINLNFDIFIRDYKLYAL